MRRIRHTQAGYSLMEVIVVMAISSVIMIIAYDLIEGAMKTSLFVESHNQLAQLSQRPVNAVSSDVFQSRAVFQNDTIGQSFLSKVVAQLPADHPIQAGYRLPLADVSTTMFGPDTSGGTHYVGNCLLVLRQLNPLAIEWNDGSSDLNFPADMYRFDFYYLSRNTKRSFGGAGYYVDLIRWRSVEFADYGQLSAFFSAVSSTPQKNTIVNGLAAAGITTAVDPGAATTADNSFYTIGTGGTLTQMTNPAIPVLPTDAANQVFGCGSMLPELGAGSISGKMLFSVGFVPAKPFVLRDPMPKWACQDASLPGYVTGFENKIVGTGASQKLLVRLLLMANYGVGKFDSQEGFAISSK